MQAIIGLAIVPIKPTLAGAKNVKIGDIDSGISMSYTTHQYVNKSMGSVSIDNYIGSFMDYSPYTKISIYLPYIGIRELNPDDVMGCTISVGYNVDVLTGGVNAYINVSGKGCIYQYCGSAIQNVPLTAINYSGAIQNAISGVGAIGTSIAGFMTGNAALGATGVMSLATQASNVASNLKPTIQRSGSMGGSSGLMSVQKPYVIIERPNISTPANFNKMWGNMTNVFMKLQDCTGFTIVDQIHLDNVICTEGEREELYKLLKEGVIL